MSHHTKLLCSLKRPCKARGAVALDQVRVRLFAGTARPVLHHIIIPLIITLQRHTLLSYIFIPTSSLTSLPVYIQKCVFVNKYNFLLTARK